MVADLFYSHAVPSIRANSKLWNVAAFERASETPVRIIRWVLKIGVKISRKKSLNKHQYAEGYISKYSIFYL
jgi:hypothetical protein